MRPVIWEHEVEAFNTATQSTNRMHDDAVAQTYGFRGGLVPGVDVWAYLTGPCVDRWGIDFLERGMLEARFLAPVYDGERVRATLDDAGAVEVVGPDSEVRARGEAALADPPPVREIGVAERSADPPAATAQLLVPGTTLGTLELVYDREGGAEYLDAVREDRAVYQAGDICHPGLLARQANYVLSRSVRLGPWIHVSTRAHHRGLVRHGDRLEVRGAVADEREHKGHRFVDVWVEITAGERAVWSAFHTAIWQPRRSR